MCCIKIHLSSFLGICKKNCVTKFRTFRVEQSKLFSVIQHPDICICVFIANVVNYMPIVHSDTGHKC